MVLLTDDAGNRKLATAEGLTTLSTRAYVAALPADQANALLDLVAADGTEFDEGAPVEDRKGKQKVIYDDYLPLPELQAAIRSGLLYQGFFNPSCVCLALCIDVRSQRALCRELRRILASG